MRIFNGLNGQITRSGGVIKMKESNYYNELLKLINDKEQNQVWIRNKIYLWENEGYISFREREDLLIKLADR